MFFCFLCFFFIQQTFLMFVNKPETGKTLQKFCIDWYTNSDHNVQCICVCWTLKLCKTSYYQLIILQSNYNKELFTEIAAKWITKQLSKKKQEEIKPESIKIIKYLMVCLCSFYIHSSYKQTKLFILCENFRIERMENYIKTFSFCIFPCSTHTCDKREGKKLSKDSPW